MGSYAVNSVAAGKVVLHAAKFAHAEVCGVLLGRASEDRDAPVLVEDAIPFFHKSENKNSPIMEVALAQAESYAASTGKKIVGFYQANERNDDTALHPSAKRIGDVIRERGGCPQGCILLLDNEGFTNFLSGEQVERLPFTLYVKRSAWEVATNLLKCDGVNVYRDLAMEKVAQGKQALLVDFSEHICDISKDWRNVNYI